ncbi:MAG TPA: MinD/ParA family protein [Candidatus Sulfotelmatobacter sp.]|nr:MinD/ParA family protein [Candidatus Sulfotelmatobacter sp.]
MSRKARRASERAPLRLVSGSPRPASEDHPANWSRPIVRSLVITSGKGGVGKSTLAANLAVALGQRGARVLLVDADFSQANLDLLLGVHPRWDLQHVLSGEKTLEDIVTPGPAGVRLVPAASGVPELADLDDYRLECLWRGMSQLEHEADVVLIDTASGVSRPVTWLCRAAREVLVVTTPEMPAFSDAYGLIKLLHQQGLTRPPHLVVNHTDSPEESEETAQRIRLVARRFLQLDLDLWGGVPYDPAVSRAVRQQEPVLTAFPNSPAAQAIRALSHQLWDESPPPPRTQSDSEPQRLEA